jgi:hypothetical protein
MGNNDRGITDQIDFIAFVALSLRSRCKQWKLKRSLYSLLLNFTVLEKT